MNTNLNIFSLKEKNKSKISKIDSKIIKSDSLSNTDSTISINGMDEFKANFQNKNFVDQWMLNNCPQFYQDFELTNFLSLGGTGVVYEGRMIKRKSKQKYAFKFKYSKKGNDNKDEFQEIGIIKKLHHKYITQIFAFTKIGKNVYYSVLELGKYGDLDKFQKIILKKKVLSETILCYFASQLLEAIEYIHKCKIIHNDIKQGNIVIDSNLDVKITDFSVSCTVANFEPDEKVEFPFMGTSKFICPEILGRILMPIREACKIDLYSLGVTLYQCAFGIYPYDLNNVDRQNYKNILENIKTIPLRFPPDTKFSPHGQHFLRGLLENNYEKRFNIYQALNHPWIKGAKYIIDEKENIGSNENFLAKLITDNVYNFNCYLEKQI